MALFLVVVTGSQAGFRTPLIEGFSIGRKTGDLLLEDDPKVSGLHAKMGLDGKGQFVLFDQGSSNGFVMAGRRVKKIAMLPGVSFRIGSTNFQVIQDDVAKVAPLSVNPVSEAIGTPPEPPRELKKKSWRDRLVETLNSQEDVVPISRPVKLGAFSPALAFDFIEGIQADQNITLGYGPRQAGFGHLDIDLIDPKIPDVAFDLLPGPGSVEIRDLSGGKMLINGRPLESHFLEEGDLITIGQTKIKVRYL